MIRWSTPEQACALCSDRGFTPNSDEVLALTELLARIDRDAAAQVVAALVRAGETAAKNALLSLPTAGSAVRARLLDVIGRVAQRSSLPELYAALVSAAGDADAQSARRAVVLLGKLSEQRRLGDELERQLMDRFTSAEPALQRAIVESVGKAGSQHGLHWLQGVTATDAELERLRSRAVLMLQRQTRRSELASVRLDRPLPRGCRVALLCRKGLGRLLAEEVQAFARIVRSDAQQVEIEHTGDLATLLQARIAIEVALLIPLKPGNTLAERVVAALALPWVTPALRAWSEGTIRFRIAWSAGRHRRAATWQLAQSIARALPELHNDPNSASWELYIDDVHARLALVPRGFEDPRFSYRERDVPAASHPTLAAALARQAAARNDDVVWDPFVGSGLELIEIARLSAPRMLYGSDHDASALAAARVNLAAAAVSNVELRQGDARSLCPPGVSLIVSNPPMGRRVARDGALLALLDDFLGNAYSCLHRGGRVVWLSPSPQHTAERAQRLGFTVQRLEAVDLGGFDAELQLLNKPA